MDTERIKSDSKLISQDGQDTGRYRTYRSRYRHKIQPVKHLVRIQSPLSWSKVVYLSWVAAAFVS